MRQVRRQLETQMGLAEGALDAEPARSTVAAYVTEFLERMLASASPTKPVALVPAPKAPPVAKPATPAAKSSKAATKPAKPAPREDDSDSEFKRPGASKKAAKRTNQSTSGGSSKLAEKIARLKRYVNQCGIRKVWYAHPHTMLR